jgi:hypothetical protein
MTIPIELGVGPDTWTVHVPPEKLLRLQRATLPVSGTDARRGSPRELVLAALDTPIGIDAPVRKAVTPDDKVAVVLDEGLPHIPELLAGLLDHLAPAGIAPEAVTVVVPAGGDQSWVDGLPDEYADLHVETHDPENEQKLEYVDTTKAGRRVYLNRTLTDADFKVVLTGRRYDPAAGHGGAEAALFPALSNGETRAAFVGQFSLAPPAAVPNALRAEAGEVAWLLGTPVFVQVIEGPGDTIAEVVAEFRTHPPANATEGARRQDARWRFTAPEPAGLVVAAVGGDPRRVTFQDLAHALATAARCCQPGGRVALLSAANPPLGEGADLLRAADDPARAGKPLGKRKPDDWPAAALWSDAAGRASLFVAAGWADEVTEELFATPLHAAAEVQRLIDAADRVLVIPDAHKTAVDTS